ncbi:MAG: single-stranded DNA-binding protein [Thermomicrobiales bacterium]
MASFAKITVMGNLGADPETRYTPNGAMVVSFSIAVNPRRRSQQGGDEPPPVWYRISAWDRLAERIDKLAQQGYIARGRQLLVTGSFEPREFQGNDGTTRMSFDVTAESFEFVGGGDRQQDGSGASGQSYGSGNRSGSFGGGSQGGRGGNDYGDGGSNRRQAFDEDDHGNGNLDDVPF